LLALHVNGRSLYIVDWRMVVVEGGNVLHHVKWREKCPGGIYVQGECPDPCCAMLRYAARCLSVYLTVCHVAVLCQSESSCPRIFAVVPSFQFFSVRNLMA